MQRPGCPGALNTTHIYNLCSCHRNLIIFNHNLCTIIFKNNVIYANYNPIKNFFSFQERWQGAMVQGCGYDHLQGGAVPGCMSLDTQIWSSGLRQGVGT